MQTPQRGELQILQNIVIDVDDSGMITSIGHRDGPVTYDFDERSVLLPGLIDTHLHAPQWPQLGTGLDLPLEKTRVVVVDVPVGTHHHVALALG